MEDKLHPSLDITGSRGSELKGKTVVIGMTGSVGCSKTPELARLLMRHGACVHTVMTEAACGLVNPELMFWSTGNRPVTELTGMIEHVALCGNVPDKADLFLIAPATANTIGKIACGIDDTPVTTFATSAIGEGIPVLIVPAMHKSMYNHPIVIENIARLQKHGMEFIMPRVEEGKAKIASPDDICETVRSRLTHSRVFAGKKFLINAGRTVEYIDPIRVITNNSSGKMGMALARQAKRRGANVTVVFGKGTAVPAEGCDIINVETSAQMQEAVFNEAETGTYDYIILAAAVSDFRPAHQSGEKISTHTTKKLVIELEPTPKTLDQIKKKSPRSTLFAFRALHGKTEKELVDDAFNRLKKAEADHIAVNDVGGESTGFETDTNEMYLIDKNKSIQKLPLDTKDNIASALLDYLIQNKKD